MFGLGEIHHSYASINWSSGGIPWNGWVPVSVSGGVAFGVGAAMLAWNCVANWAATSLAIAA